MIILFYGFLYSNFVGICVAELNDKDGRFVDLYQRLQFDNLLSKDDLVYDHNCPSIQVELSKRTCPICFLYHSSAAAMKRHQKMHSSKHLKEHQTITLKKKEQFQIIDNVDSESEEDTRNESVIHNENDDQSGAPLIENIFDFLASDFVEL